MASITGLQSGNFTDIDVIYSISIDGDSGQTGQVLSSDGENTLWINGSAIDREDLTAADTTITISGGAYDGAVARTIQTNKVPNALTAGTNISFNTGTTYDGSGAITITATDNDNQLTLVEGSGITITNLGGLNRRIACDVDADTIDFDGVELAVQKVPNALTAGTNVSFATADGGTQSIFNGGEALTLNATDTNTQLNLTADAPIVIDSSAGGLNKNVELNFDSNTLNIGSGNLTVSKVPNVLTAGNNISFVVTANGSSASTYDGATGITITGTDTNTTYQGGQNISIDTSTSPDTINLNDTLNPVQLIVMKQNVATAIIGNAGSGGRTGMSDFQLTSSSNIISPYCFHNIYDPSSLDFDALTTSYTAGGILNGVKKDLVAAQTSLCVELLCYNYGVSSNKTTRIRLADKGGAEFSVGTTQGGQGTGTRSTERNVHSMDETDKQGLRITWFIQGLTVGNTYSFYPQATTSSTANYLAAGGSGSSGYPASFLRGYYLPS
tara:strand:- start:593 stop:2089 length:1497 start_codon:yes stop_codon:yes gene_type:complete